MKTRILTVGVLVVALLVAGLVPATAQSPVSEFDTILADRIIVTDSITSPDTTLSDDLTVTDDLIVNGDSTVQALAVNGAMLAGVVSVGAFDADSISSDTTITAADITASDDVTVTGSLVGSTGAFSGAISGASFTGAVIASKLSAAEGADLTVTNGGTITPTHSLHALTSTGNVWTDSIAASQFQVLILYNSAATTITISDTGTLKLAGDFAMGQTDTLTLVFRNPNWYELARTNN